MRSRAVTTALIVAAIVAGGLASAPPRAGAVDGASARQAVALGPTAPVIAKPLRAGVSPIRAAASDALAAATTRVGIGADPLDDAASTPMLADCSSITATGREYARLHDVSLCGADTTPTSEPLRTEQVGGEECGSISLVMTSRGGGVAAVEWRVESVTGPVLGVELDVSYSGRAGGVMRRFIDRSASQRARESTVAFLGVGRAAATVSGTVETFLATCRIAPASVRIHVR